MRDGGVRVWEMAVRVREMAVGECERWRCESVRDGGERVREMAV